MCEECFENNQNGKNIRIGNPRYNIQTQNTTYNIWTYNIQNLNNRLLCHGNKNK